MNLLDDYIEGLKNAYIKVNKEDEWNNFVSNRVKLDESKIENLNNLNVSNTLIELLKYTDGTDNESFVFLGSDIEGLGYYLIDSDNMLIPNRFTNEYFIEVHNNNPSNIDEKIDSLTATVKELDSKPKENWNKVISTIITVIATALATGAVAAILAHMS